MALVDQRCRRRTAMQDSTALDAAMRYVAAQGVTSVHTWARGTISTCSSARTQAGRAATRIYAAVPIDTWERLRDDVAAHGRGDAWLRIGALKGFVDGSLGSHTAAMLEPFTDAPNDRGLFVNTTEDLYDWTTGADAAGLHVIVHAIGDRANRTQLDIYERVDARERTARPAIPHRARAAPRAGGHPALRRAGRDRQHAAVSRHRRRPMGGDGDRPGAREDDVCVSLAARRRARRWRSAATGSSRRRRRSRGSTRP